MAKPVAIRVAEHRRRQQAEGLLSLTVVVPKGDARFFREIAATARQKHRGRAALHQAGPAAGRTLTAAQLKMAERWAARSGLKLRLTRPGLSLAEVLARNVAHELVREGWPIGRNLGSERELRERYGVGRNVLRDAVRQLEVQSIVRLKRGAEGGLYVTEPTLESAAYLAGVYLEYRKVSRGQLQEARRGIQLLVLDGCMDRMDAVSRRRLRSAIDAEKGIKRGAGAQEFQKLHGLMAQLAANPALELFLDVILRMYRFHSRADDSSLADVSTTMRRHHREIVSAMVTGQRSHARGAMLRYLDFVDEILA